MLIDSSLLFVKLFALNMHVIMHIIMHVIIIFISSIYMYLDIGFVSKIKEILKRAQCRVV